jgi:NADH dehydrogenase (ubiquinone) 1 alpha subcomplex subunit 2
VDNYVAVKQENPNFPFIIRECSGADALLVARYSRSRLTLGYGVEKKEYLTNMTKDEIECKRVVTSAGG